MGMDHGHVPISLAARECRPVPEGTPALAEERRDELWEQLGKEWMMVAGERLEREFLFEDFAGALAFANRVGGLAEEVNHHPKIELSWGRVKLAISTHTVDGLSETDFIWAARAQELY